MVPEDINFTTVLAPFTVIIGFPVQTLLKLTVGIDKSTNPDPPERPTVAVVGPKLLPAPPPNPFGAEAPHAPPLSLAVSGVVFVHPAPPPPKLNGGFVKLVVRPTPPVRVKVDPPVPAPPPTPKMLSIQHPL